MSSARDQGKTPKKTKHIHVLHVDQCVGCQLCQFACSERFGDAGIAHTAIWVHSAGDFERGFIISVCQACEDPPCAHVCPTSALIPKEGGGITFNVKKCIGCKNCVKACKLDAILWDPSMNKPIPCIYCGLCARACPHGVLKLLSKGEVSIE